MDLVSFTIYLISCTVCTTMSAMLLLNKGIQTASPNNRLYSKGKRCIAVYAAIGAFSDFIAISFISSGISQLVLDRFFSPLMFYFKMCVAVVGLTSLLHSQKFTYAKTLPWTIPVVAVALTHIVIFITKHGIDFRSPDYDIYLTTDISNILTYLLDAAVVMESALSIYFIGNKAIRFHRNIDNYVYGNRRERSKWLLYTVGAFVALFAINAADFIVSTYIFDLVTKLMRSVLLFMSTVCVLNVQEIYLDTVPAFDQKLDLQNGSFFSSGHSGKEIEEPQPSDIVSRVNAWTRRIDKPFLHESITIADVANEMNVSARQLSQYINNFKNVNFNTWINRLKVAEVKKLIDTRPDMKFTDIAVHTGFADAPTLSKIFKQIEGVSPSVYRKQQSQKQAY